jgi:hypothetical protein
LTRSSSGEEEEEETIPDFILQYDGQEVIAIHPQG